MIIIAFGANLNSHVGSPMVTIKSAISALQSRGIIFVKYSRFFETTPVPPSNNRNYINSVAIIETQMNPYELLNACHEVELMYGRERSYKNSPRTIDIDILAYNNIVIKNRKIQIPHPRLHEREFVMIPLGEIAPNWKHPFLNISISELISNLETNNKVFPLDEFF
ncbi:MAG: 2-amino-4-hydroxy-6-hydroxymethyldihydropteridine diphosphokinase [Pseudomonadota bacterium]|nr:2-amino-4-hydroxy-6-hydroxymethyldihydropteridine diphosphokinase [Pseudomonadota bacterium]